MSAGACQSNPAKTRAAAAGGSGSSDGRPFARPPGRLCAAASVPPAVEVPKRLYGRF